MDRIAAMWTMCMLLLFIGNVTAMLVYVLERHSFRVYSIESIGCARTVSIVTSITGLVVFAYMLIRHGLGF